MNTELPFLHQKKVRAMGNILAVVSSLALLFSLLLLPLSLLILSPWPAVTQAEEYLSENGAAEARLHTEDLTDEELKSAFKEVFTEETMDLPEGATEEMFFNTLIYVTRRDAGEDVPLPEGGVIRELINPALAFFPEGITADTTVGELIEMDRAFFETHSNSYRFLTLLAAAFYALVAIVMLRMALAWRRADPLGRGTILGLRYLAVLFLVQFFAALLIGPFIPQAEYSDLLYHSMIYQLSIDMLFTNGANLSCGIVFLALSWVLEHGRKMKEEQALTI